jgi:hypothetical protein
MLAEDCLRGKRPECAHKHLEINEAGLCNHDKRDFVRAASGASMFYVMAFRVMSRAIGWKSLMGEIIE